MNIRIVQLSDPHLYQDPDGLLAGVRTWDTFRAVLEQATSRHGEIDYLILTGDLAQDEALETYRRLRGSLERWLDRCRIIPGNHDDRGNLRQVFPELFPESDGTLNFSFSAGDWQLIGLDSQIPGEVTGLVDDLQLAWLREELGRVSGKPVMLFIHHPPIPISVDWIDALGLTGSSGLVQLIETSSQIRVVCAGHVHQEFAGMIGSTRMYTTPSTCVQFGAHAEKTFDTRMAGYRLITLAGDSWDTEVVRLLEDRVSAPQSKRQHPD